MAPTQISMPHTPSTPKTPRKHTPIPFTPKCALAPAPAGLRTPQSRPSPRVPNAPRRARISTVPRPPAFAASLADAAQAHAFHARLADPHPDLEAPDQAAAWSAPALRGRDRHGPLSVEPPAPLKALRIPSQPPAHLELARDKPPDTPTSLKAERQQRKQANQPAEH
ncbi:hypothetical protein A1Q1_07654 [Trichosporon asahii var. asahii CBS 2479]|uniref:Uncharacterized protein n=1 Tax=Trichosporon asahii var. asahii (strain ATCC 90039 / CBS 2479 / JCM 2466 / KCTC 7840 / NBRC 103889/ NCYC 2677 / UAMH 7654) TaxID=1186058 RepID=J4UHT7_TRIAS|nr:hypothetical protein A1Q1_07654 [Trichosporon asahii var. asahii CBS 2479]EJT51190.1 hypothetical protein A1Q1_07654 [Trichosporon asahii var. asahii CBS 2479]